MDVLKYISLIALLFPLAVNAQQEADDRMGEGIEMLFSDDRSNQADTDLIDALMAVRNHPIDLNTGNMDILVQAGLLSPRQLADIQEHIKQNDAFYSLYELQSIGSLSMEDIYRLLPFVTLRKAKDYHQSLGDMLSKGKYRLTLRWNTSFPRTRGLQAPSDTEMPAFTGTAHGAIIRFEYNFNRRLRYGFTFESDAGEPLFNAKAKGMDHQVAHVFYQGSGLLRNLALGHYHLQLGQGLVLWTGFGFGKSALIRNIQKTGPTLRPYTSLNESRQMQGTAATLQFGNIEVTPYFSAKRIDARLDTTENGIRMATSPRTGLHRSITERRGRKTTPEWISGMQIAYKKGQNTVGISSTYRQTKHPPTIGRAAYETFVVESQSSWHHSLSHSIQRKNTLWFGEAAVSHGVQKNTWGMATIQGVLINPHPSMEWVLSGRYFHPNYIALDYSEAFAESTLPRNEMGLYMGTRWMLSPKVTWGQFVDLYHLPKPSFASDIPVTGVDYLSVFDYKIKRKWNAQLRFRWERKNQNESVDTQKTPLASPFVRSSLRAHLSVEPKDGLFLRYRIEGSLGGFADSLLKGFMMYQDIRWRPLQRKFSCNARLTWYKTEGFDARIYAYEPGIPSRFQVPVFSGSGLRTLLMVGYKPTSFLTCYAQYIYTHRTDVLETGSGQNLREGPDTHSLNAMVRFTL